MQKKLTGANEGRGVQRWDSTKRCWDPLRSPAKPHKTKACHQERMTSLRAPGGELTSHKIKKSKITKGIIVIYPGSYKGSAKEPLSVVRDGYLKTKKYK